MIEGPKNCAEIGKPQRQAGAAKNWKSPRTLTVAQNMASQVQKLQIIAYVVSGANCKLQNCTIWRSRESVLYKKTHCGGLCCQSARICWSICYQCDCHWFLICNPYCTKTLWSELTGVCVVGVCGSVLTQICLWTCFVDRAVRQGLSTMKTNKGTTSWWHNLHDLMMLFLLTFTYRDYIFV